MQFRPLSASLSIDAAYFYEKGKVKKCHRATNCKVKATDSTVTATNFIVKATIFPYKELTLGEMAQISVLKKTDCATKTL
jgi:hypothetical protein